MRSKILAGVVAALVVAGCSQKGVVVDKRLKPSPFAYSTGLDAIYSFMLRDEQGRVHSQMVTPEVFQRYEVGDYFDDQQSGPARRERWSSESVSDSKEVKPVHHRATHRKHHATSASHKVKHHLRAVAKARDDERKPHGLDIRP